VTIEVVRPVYLLLDTSGSTVRDRWIGACNSVLPHVVEALEGRQSKGSDVLYHLSLMTYGTTVSLEIGLAEVNEIRALPALSAEGLSSLASALAALAKVVQDDAAQLRSDGFTIAPPSATVIMHGLPTDRASYLLASRLALEEASPSPCLHAVCSAGTDPLVLRGLGFHRWSFVQEADASTELAATVSNALICDDAPALP
jgi:uncharacterized protein YegL